MSKLKDTLINRSTLELIIPKVTKVQATYGDRVQKMKERLLVAAINARFTALNMRVSLSDDWYLSDKDHLVLSVSGDNDKEIKCRVTEAVNVLKQIREQRLLRTGISTFEGECCAETQPYLCCEKFRSMV